MKLGAAGESFSINPVIKVVAVPGSVTKIDKSLIEISAPGRQQRPISLFGIFGNDVYNGIDSVCSPDGASGSSDDFNALNILEQCVLNLPVHSGEERRVNGPTID